MDDPRYGRATIYIAGPMRHKRGCNFDAFDEASLRGQALGFNIISPAEMDRFAGINPAPDDPCDGSKLSQADIDAIVARDIAAIMSLKQENGDGIALLPGWGHSRGTNAEVGVGLWRNLMILDARTFQPIQIRTVAYEIKPVKCYGVSCGLVRDDGIINVGQAIADGRLR